jgi:hypothetical protein
MTTVASTTTTQPTTSTTTINDDYGNSCEQAFTAPINSFLDGALDYVGDYDYFKIVVPADGTLTVYTKGTTDTYGILKDNACNTIETDDDDGVGSNFSISRALTANTYFVAVQGVGTGFYTFFVEFTANPSTTSTTAVLSTTTAVSSTTTIPVSTTTSTTQPTTTTTIAGPCPATQVLGADNPKLDNLRALRDSRLAQSAVGRRIIGIYYSNAASINAALERSPLLQAAARKILEAIAPAVGKKEE